MAECKYVSAIGILESCKINNNGIIPYSGRLKYIDINKVNDGDTIYIHPELLRRFVIKKLPYMKKYFILVTGLRDHVIPYEALSNDEFDTLINNKYLIHWYAQNLNINHFKMSIIPIGLDYNVSKTNTMEINLNSIEQEKILISIINTGEPFLNRIHKIYNTSHLFLDRFGERQYAKNSIPEDLIIHQKERIPRTRMWNEYIKYAFILSPIGYGYDCHRTYEALCLGCIPIMKKIPPLEKIFENLPVLFVNDYTDINKALLEDTLYTYSNNTFDYSKLKLKYWMDKINGSNESDELNIINESEKPKKPKELKESKESKELKKSKKPKKSKKSKKSH